MAEYDSYALGLRMLGDPSIDGGEQIATGQFRILSEAESWQALMSLLPILRDACHRAIADTEATLGIVLAKYW